MLIEDCSLREEAGRIRHPFGEMLPQDRPRQRIGEDVQYEWTPHWIVSDGDWRTHEKITVRGERGILGQTEEVGCCGVERRILRKALCLDVQPLERCHADDGQNILSGAVNLGASGGTVSAYDVVDEFPADIEGKTLCRLNRLQEPALVALLFLLRICGDVVGRSMYIRRGDKLTGKNTFSGAQPLFGLPAHTAECYRCVAWFSHGNGQTIEHLGGQRAARNIRREHERAVQQFRRIRLHDKRIRIACRRCVRTAQHRPERRLDSVHPKGTLSAGDGIRRVTVCEKILRREDIGVHCISARLAVCGELHEKVVIIGILLRACEERIKQFLCVLIIAPEYGAVFAHLMPPSAAGIPPRCLRCLLGTLACADRRMYAARNRRSHILSLSRGCADRW